MQAIGQETLMACGIGSSMGHLGRKFGRAWTLTPGAGAVAEAMHNSITGS